MSGIKDIFFTVEEYLNQGLDEAEIASKLDIPVDMVEEIVATIDKNNFDSDMAADPYRLI